MIKILKYLLILAVLAAISISVYVATKDGKYEIKLEKKSNLPSDAIYKYLSDIRNYQQWNDQGINAIKLDSVYIGKGAKATFDKGNISIKELIPNEKIVYKELRGNEEITHEITLTDLSNANTKITLKANGILNFKQKWEAFFAGGAQAMYEKRFDEILKKIDFYLKEELEKFELTPKGIEFFPETFYLEQIITSPINELGDKIFESMQHMQNFVIQNSFLKIKGKPFTVFGKMDVLTGEVTYAVRLPIDQEIHIASGSDMLFGKTPAFYAYKTILKGDYKFSDKAWEKNIEEIAKNQLTQNFNITPIAIFQNSILETHRPSLWVTEMLTPINESALPTKNPENNNTSATVKKDTIKNQI